MRTLRFWLPNRGAKFEVGPAPYTPPAANEVVVRLHAVAVNPVDGIPGYAYLGCTHQEPPRRRAAAILTQTLVAQPLPCARFNAQAAVFERNISLEYGRDFKRPAFAHRERPPRCSAVVDPGTGMRATGNAVLAVVFAKAAGPRCQNAVEDPAPLQSVRREAQICQWFAIRYDP
jgi:hypothetical protein